MRLLGGSLEDDENSFEVLGVTGEESVERLWRAALFSASMKKREGPEPSSSASAAEAVSSVLDRPWATSIFDIASTA
jgi:hypothetical protein